MKKFFWLLILLLPFYVFAYSKYVIPGGDTLGIEANSNGVIVIGFYEVDGMKINRNLRIGDNIIEVNKVKINAISDLSKLIEEYMIDDSVDITYIRNDKKYNTKLNLLYDDGEYRTGLYVKGSVLGIGTLTYIDPNSKVYGVLGHEIVNWRSITK